jgi:hypothetical protein
MTEADIMDFQILQRCARSRIFFAFALSQLLAACAIEGYGRGNTSEVRDQVVNALNAASSHALTLDPNFFSVRALKSITADKGNWQVRFEMRSPPNEVVLGGGVTFYVDKRTWLVTETRAEQ